MIDLMKLDDVCLDVVVIFQQIMSGEMDIMENREARALGPFGVGQMIGQAVNQIGMKAMMGTPVSEEEVRDVAETLAGIAETFGVEALREPVARMNALCEEAE